MSKTPDNDTHKLLLDVAEEMFAKRGYGSVKLRDIAETLGMKHASLYYYAPNGKQQLYVEVTERMLHRHRQGIDKAIADAGSNVGDQLQAIGQWLISQPSINMDRMFNVDMPGLDAAHATRLAQLAWETLTGPLTQVLDQAKTAGSVDVPDTEIAAISLISLIQSIHGVPETVLRSPDERQEIARRVVDMMLYGLFRR